MTGHWFCRSCGSHVPNGFGHACASQKPKTSDERLRNIDDSMKRMDAKYGWIDWLFR
jgi:hypothetical protein